MNDGIDLVFAFLIGALVGMGELVGRYRDEPGRAIRSRPALVYMAINGAASAGALGLAHVFGWTFGADPGTVQARATQVLVAGFGAMAVFRSSLFLYRVGNKEVGIGPVAFLQVVLEATDRGVDRHRAQARSEWVRRNMVDLEFKDVAIALPAYAIGLMQNLSQQDQSVLSDRVNDVRTSPQDERMKVMSLGLLVMDAVGEDVLEEAVLTVRKELGLDPPLQVGGGPLAVLSRRKSTPDAGSAATDPARAYAPEDAAGLAAAAVVDPPAEAGGDPQVAAAAEEPPAAVEIVPVAEAPVAEPPIAAPAQPPVAVPAKPPKPKRVET
jgi:hypothetical protein